jgi:ribosomal protein S18 acetylase RimI-like enzyme
MDAQAQRHGTFMGTSGGIRSVWQQSVQQHAAHGRATGRLGCRPWSASKASSWSLPVDDKGTVISDPNGTIEIRELAPDGIELIREIDRSEHVDRHYAVRGGRLQSADVDIDVPPWDPEGHGDHSSARRIAEFRPVVESGATLLGAFVDGVFAGIAIVDPTFEDRTAWFAFLHVSRAQRRRGVAAALWAAGSKIAADAGAASMYVSATPSGSAVGFYTSRGCKLAEPPHPALFAKEPEDIHLVCPIT